ncbi:hypothetical protein Ciccas_004558 [Cichlidogyrus casuarinus]|uniref:Uncharacterized protein n=1 Tax=Cichlidogyrus casuarinus TaxID=1844966 RepID=A0ABD2QB89_9PLAT
MEKLCEALKQLEEETGRMSKIDYTLPAQRTTMPVGANNSLQNPVLLASLEKCREQLQMACQMLNIFSLLSETAFGNLSKEAYISSIVGTLVQTARSVNGTPIGMSHYSIGKELLDLLVPFLARFPAQTCDYFFSNDCSLHRLFFECLARPGSESIREYLRDDYQDKLVELIRSLTLSSSQDNAAAAHLAVFIVCSEEHFPFLASCKRIVTALREFWRSDSFVEWHAHLMKNCDNEYRFHLWDQPKIVMHALLRQVKLVKSDKATVPLLYELVAGVARFRSINDWSQLKTYLKELAETKPVTWHRSIFLHFMDVLDMALNPNPRQSLIETGDTLTRLMSHLVLPITQCALLKNARDFMGTLPGDLDAAPTKHEADLIWVFLHKLMQHAILDMCYSLRIMLFQLACLFVEHAPDYIQVCLPCLL